MNLHEQISLDIQGVVEGLAGADIISPSYVARELLDLYAGASIDPHIAYASREHFKQMARRVLAGRYDAESDDNEAHQGELFSGHLQRRYPIPRASGSEPVYKLREALTPQERAWNVLSLRSSARARLLHADALEAEGQHAADPIESGRAA
ncbi:MAG: hypothetical protein KA744_14985 [Phenylobacterium sp.]|nr:hypothetical protein [Phenylobacterium sp.]